MYLGGLCFITDCRIPRLSLEEIVLAALAAGIKWIQFRDKEMCRREVFRKAVMLRELTSAYNAILIVNDYADIALASEADGVHLGQEDLPIKYARRILGEEKIIGISTHSLTEAVHAESAGANYIGFGPIFPTLTKDAGPPKGIGMLTEIKKQIHIPIVAIGGIRQDNAFPVYQAGADAVAAASSLLTGDIGENVRKFLVLIAGAR